MSEENLVFVDAFKAGKTIKTKSGKVVEDIHTNTLSAFVAVVDGKPLYYGDAEGGTYPCDRNMDLVIEEPQ